MVRKSYNTWNKESVLDVQIPEVGTLALTPDAWVARIQLHCLLYDTATRSPGLETANGRLGGWLDGRGASRGRRAKCRCPGARS